MTKPELAMFAKQDGTGRAYKHPFRTLGNGKPLTSPSVTTILNLVNKEALIQWAVNQTVEWAAANVNLLYVKSEDDIKRWGKYRWTDVRDERAEVGTGVHEYIEAENTGSWTFPVLDDEQVRIIEQWELLKQRYIITPHRSEFTVWGALDEVDSNGDPIDLSWAGTADGLWDITDTQTGESWSNLVIDLKTSKNTWPEHWMQLSALRHANVVMTKQPDGTWIEEELPQGDGTAIIHLREDKFKVTIETDPKLLDIQYNQFMSYRAVWEYKKQSEAFVTARDKTEAMKF